MRLFINQTNKLKTTPIVDIDSGLPLDTLVVTARVLDGVTELSTATLAHTSGGVYSGTLGVIAGLEDDTNYTLEVTVKQSGTNIWYFKGPIKAIIRDVQT